MYAANVYIQVCEGDDQNVGVISHMKHKNVP